jgi:hypothetical protein
MSPVVKVSSPDGRMIGTHIKDSENQWIVMLAKNASDIFLIGSVKYTLDGAGSAHHLILNLKKNFNYDIYDNGTKILTKASGNGGVLSFSTTLGSFHTLQITEAGVAPPPTDITPISTSRICSKVIGSTSDVIFLK